MMTVSNWFTHLSFVAACTCICAGLGTGCGHRQTNVSTNVQAKVTPITPGQVTSGQITSGSVSPAPMTPTTNPVLAAVIPATAPALTTYHCPTADLQFSYPADWKTGKAHTAMFAVTKDQCSLNLDIPKLPWHPPGMITLKMVASGYEDDLKKNQLPDAVQQEDCPVDVPGAKACRITTDGHDHGKPMCDIAVIMIHADRVYILSADCDQADLDFTRKTLDEAVSSLKWAK